MDQLEQDKEIVEFCKKSLSYRKQLSGEEHEVNQQRLLSPNLRINGGTVASWLVRSNSDRVVRVRALAGDIVLFKLVPANLILGGNLLTSHPRGSRNTP